MHPGSEPENREAPPPRQHIKGLNGLRAIAVGLVVLNHKTLLGAAIGPGGYGVRLFFVLSGFLIIGILSERKAALDLGTTTARQEMLRFYANRLYRIWPIYFLVIGISIALGIAGVFPPVPKTQIVAASTFTLNMLMFLGDLPPHNIAQLWSVAVEEQFYLWAAPLFLFAARSRFAAICAAIVLVSLGWRLALEGHGVATFRIYVDSISNFGYMGLGGLAAVYLLGDRRYGRYAPVALALFLVTPLVVWTLNRDSPPGYLVLTLFPLLIPLILVGIAQNQSSWLVRVLELRPIEYIGRISYGIYLYHDLVRFERLEGPVRFMTEVAVSLLIASASWHGLEKPILRWRDARRASARRIGAPLAGT